MFKESITDIILQINDYLKYPLLKIQNYDVTLWSILIFILIVSLSKTIADKIGKLIVVGYLSRGSFDLGKQHAIEKIINYTIYVFGVVIALQTVGVNLSALLAGGAVLAVGIGFGIQNIVTNFISGILILFENPIKKGDFVEVGNVLGTVEEISIRCTIITTLDNIRIIVPNSKFISENVTNWSHKENDTRIHLDVGVAYSSDIDKVESILLDIAARDKDILISPRAEVQFKGFSESSLSFSLLVWIDEPQKFNTIKSKLYFSIFKEFNKNGIVIPFPQRDLNIKEINQDVFRNIEESESKNKRVDNDLVTVNLDKDEDIKI